MNRAALMANQQTAMLADRYTQRAALYEALWSPIIRPAGECLISRLSRSNGMLRIARDRHSGGWLALMDVQKLALPANGFDAAVVAFVLFHVPSPERCLTEVNRVLKPGGTVGSVTWGTERVPMANAIRDEELEAAGAHYLELPATDNRACCDSAQKMTTLLGQAGFISIKVWSESIEHRWRPEDHFDYQVGSTSRLRLQSLDVENRKACLRRVRDRLSGAEDEQYVYRGEVFVATAVKADHPAGNH